MAIPSASLAQRPAMISTDNTFPNSIENRRADTDVAMSEKTNGEMGGHAFSTGTAPPKALVDMSAPISPSSDTTAVEFTGDVDTNHEIPSQEVLKSVEDMPLLDKDGKTVPFKTLYSGPNVTRRVLIIFIRHFFCGVSSYLVSFFQAA